MTEDKLTAIVNAASYRTAPDVTLALFREHGYHIEPGLLPEAYCDDLLRVALSRPSASDGSFRPIPMPHREHPAFLGMMKYPPIVEIVELLLGGRASGLGGEYFYNRPGTPGFTPHQDNFYIQAPPDQFLSVWTALCDVTPENGGLTFSPGSHKLGQLSVRNGQMLTDPGQNPGAQAIECLLPENAPWVDISLTKGSVVFFHGFLAHRSGNNVSQLFRHSFLATYIRSGAPFRAGEYQQRREVDLHSA